jgi:hypothetical protein
MPPDGIQPVLHVVSSRAVLIVFMAVTMAMET